MINTHINSGVLAHLSRVSPVSTTTHVASASSVHVASVHRDASVHGPPSGSHVTPHWVAPGGTAEAGNVAAAPVEVSTAVEASSEGWRRQETTWWPVEAATGAWSCRDHKWVKLESLTMMYLINSF